MDKYEFTDRQREEIAAMIIGLWGCNFQTGVTTENTKHKLRGLPYLASQLGPNHPVRFFYFHLDGQVDEKLG